MHLCVVGAGSLEKVEGHTWDMFVGHMYAGVSSIVCGGVQTLGLPELHISVVYRGNMSCQTADWAHAGLDTAGFCSVPALPQSTFAPSAPTRAGGSWLAQRVLVAWSVFSHGFLSAQQALGRRTAPAAQKLLVHSELPSELFSPRVAPTLSISLFSLLL